ncbi:MAG: tRNA (N6-threonylcarbamoyladenosine(37)-N6)-methyltransferase TrmO [Dehalococcoidales bacterium]|nr:tRNA (N6-threonylcarbamoyladenosine(37)-N6)-methyltransferase TrmO [Dehalococcoidales bacterium]MDD3264977.1 tRNA (N6-threonylcarbamoyladenosine(37)-N6)-methyltransferase TrmO [Dehalococcoidales bacterium]MDD4322590.1 tRNA (N6-threonylcarbamoyladenosine(37)-N6)-methyltransferase TrmO [Dehalococcoidales bacterium]MDD4794805.1 tRNA (N6-threonylcarbamoyladenosine(37)-N6)-methyltransferase TrmO [Dehalococcoidales bacterium]
MDNSKLIGYSPIGIAHSRFTEMKNTPVQGAFAPQATGEIEVFEEYRDGLKDLDTFTHIILLYHFHLSQGYDLVSEPQIEDDPHGVFSMRVNRRPNAIGFSVVKLDRIDGNILHVSEFDILDGTPILDIKPFVNMMDNRPDASNGWVKPPHMEDIQNETSKRASGN